MKNDYSSKIYLEANENKEIERIEIKGNVVSLMALLCTAFDDCHEFYEVVSQAMDFYKRGKENDVSVEIELN